MLARLSRPGAARSVLLAVAVFSGNAALAGIGYASMLQVSGVSVAWPPSGFMLAVLALLDRRDWPLAIAAGFLGNVAVDLSEAMPFGKVIAGGAANSIEVIAAAWVFTRLAGTPAALTSLRSAATFVVGSAILSNAITALVGALVLHSGSMPYWRGWFVWWVGDGLGMLIVAPAVLAWHTAVHGHVRLVRSIVEGVLLLTGLAVVAHLLLSQPPGTGQGFRLDPFTILPLLFWIAVRTGPRGSAIGTVLVSAIALWNASRNHGPFADAALSVDGRVLEIYAYLTVLSVSSLFATAIMQERGAAEAQVVNEARRATLVAEVVGAVSGSEHLHESLERCAGVIARHFPDAQVRIWTMSADKTLLEPQASAGPHGPDHPDAPVPAGSHVVVARVAETAEPYVSEAGGAVPDLWPRPLPDARQGGGAAAYPLTLEGRVLGVLAVRTSKPVQPWMAEGLLLAADRIAEGIVRKRLEDTRDQLVSLLHAATDFITIGTPDGPPTYLNPAIRAALGIAETERVTSLYDFRPPGFRDLLVHTILPAVMRDGSWTGETEYIARDGTRIPVSQTSVVHHTQDGRVAFISTISRDIRSRRRMEDVLRQSQKMEAIGLLAGGIAHDFNNLLTAILGYAEVLVSDALPIDEQRTAALEIRDAGIRAARLTRQLLAFGRQQMLQPHTTRISDVLGALLPMLRRLVGEHIDIRSAPGADRPIFADVTQLEQIILNLAINASDAMPRGGSLVLRTATVDLDEPLDASPLQVAPGRYAVLEVSDTGEGMDADTRSRMFEPFFTTKPTGRGTGLGLSTVYGIVKQMHGGISVDSEPGTGTTFRIYLPVDESAHPEALPGEAAPKPIVDGQETLLLVEDEPGVRKFAQRTLERYGYRVLTAADPAEALRVAEAAAAPIDLVLTDIRMPGGTGLELVEALRRQRPAVRALFMSGYSNLPESLTGGPVDPHYFLAKPFVGADLAARVRAILDERRRTPAG